MIMNVHYFQNLHKCEKFKESLTCVCVCVCETSPTKPPTWTKKGPHIKPDKFSRPNKLSEQSNHAGWSAYKNS